MSKSVQNTSGMARVIYCGPNIPGGSLMQYTVYKNGLPAHLNALMDKCPEIRDLFVPVADLGNVQAELKQPGTIGYRNYQLVAEFCKKGAI